MHKNKDGFGVKELLLILVVLGLVCGVGYYVYKHHHKNIVTVSNSTDSKPKIKDKADDATTKNVQKSVTTQEIVNSTSCEFQKASVSEWQPKLASSSEIKDLETEQGPTISYTTTVGSVCKLTNGSTLISFSHLKDAKASDGSTNAKLAHGVFVFSATNEKLIADTNLGCPYIPPDSTTAPSVEKVDNNVATLICRGFTTPNYSFDLTSKTYTKLQP